MTYIIESDDNFEFHTNLKQLLHPLIEVIGKYNWLLTNQEYLILDVEQKGKLLELNTSSEKIEFLGHEFKEMVETRKIQFVWGVFCAFKNKIPNIQREELHYADGNENIWKKPNDFLNPKSEIEIICFDGILTLIKFKNPKHEEKFIEHFQNAKLLEYNDN